MSNENYQRLQKIRSEWCQRQVPLIECSHITIRLDGLQVSDIPSFYIALGEAVNGSGGYYGGCLDALDDCLCGGFGLIPPFTLEITEMVSVRRAIENSTEEWCRRHIRSLAECDALVLDSDEYNKDEILEEMIQISYFRSLLDLFADRDVLVREFSKP